jgi:hypothetical protein
MVTTIRPCVNIDYIVWWAFFAPLRTDQSVRGLPSVLRILIHLFFSIAPRNNSFSTTNTMKRKIRHNVLEILDSNIPPRIFIRTRVQLVLNDYYVNDWIPGMVMLPDYFMCIKNHVTFCNCIRLFSIGYYCQSTSIPTGSRFYFPLYSSQCTFDHTNIITCSEMCAHRVTYSITYLQLSFFLIHSKTDVGMTTDSRSSVILKSY